MLTPDSSRTRGISFTNLLQWEMWLKHILRLIVRYFAKEIYLADFLGLMHEQQAAGPGTGSS